LQQSDRQKITAVLVVGAVKEEETDVALVLACTACVHVYT